MTRGWLWAVIGIWWFWAQTAAAQGGVRQSLRAETRVAEVGEGFSVTFTVLADAGGPTPSSPSLVAPPGITLRGPSLSTQQQVSISGGQITQVAGTSATWIATASRPGTVRLGPATARLGTDTVRSDTVTVEIVPAGKGLGRRGRRRVRDPFGFFDPFGGGFPQLPGFGDPFGLDQPVEVPGESPNLPDDFRLEVAPDPQAFLRALARPRRVVLGEQVTYSVLAYVRRGKFLEGSGKEPQYPDFLATPIVETVRDQDAYRVKIGDDLWTAIKMRELALFPVRTGTLTILPMTMAFQVLGSRRTVERTAQPIEIAVEEPPTEGRPPGYVLGDTGHFSLEAKVEPRAVAVGEAVSAVITVRGSGNFPLHLRVPQQSGVEWLPPTTSDGITLADGRPSGWRRFAHVVRLLRPGKVDLGSVTLPYWDPERRAYGTARAPLGTVEVTGAAAAAPLAADEDALTGLLPPRRTLGLAAPPRLDWGDRPGFWALVVGSPVGIWLAGLVAAGLQRVAERWRRREPSPRRAAQRELAEARAAARAGDSGAVAAAAERALHRIVLASAGVSIRGIPRGELAARLAERGLTPAAAGQLAGLLDDADTARFTGSANADAAALLARATALVRTIAAHPARTREEGS